MPKRLRSQSLIHPSQHWDETVPPPLRLPPLRHQGIARKPSGSRPERPPLTELHLQVLAQLGTEPQGATAIGRRIGAERGVVSSALYSLGLRDLARIVPRKGWVATGRQP